MPDRLIWADRLKPIAEALVVALAPRRQQLEFHQTAQVHFELGVSEACRLAQLTT